ncbi:MAG: hypothetical protein M1837_001467 [Sclerophora amabilis]|nr:MAG: hypothetical protein M1837_001467 [Sclerophora amabilis]
MIAPGTRSEGSPSHIQHASPLTPSHISIAQLTPLLSSPASSSIRAIVTLVWPYSSSRRTLTLLLAEPDSRLRQSHGQVKVQFTGSSAEAVAKSRVGIGDDIVLSLEGVEWIKDETTIRTPGKDVECALRFAERLLLQINGSSDQVSIINVDHPAPSPTAQPQPSVPVSPRTPPQPFSLRKTTASDHWVSPAFLKNASLSLAPARRAPYDPFAIDDGYVEGKGRKKPRFSAGGGGTWRYVDRSPSPEKVGTDAAFELEDKGATVLKDDLAHTDAEQTLLHDSPLDSQAEVTALGQNGALGSHHHEQENHLEAKPMSEYDNDLDVSSQHSVIVGLSQYKDDSRLSRNSSRSDSARPFRLNSPSSQGTSSAHSSPRLDPAQIRQPQSLSPQTGTVAEQPSMAPPESSHARLQTSQNASVPHLITDSAPWTDAPLAPRLQPIRSPTLPQVSPFSSRFKESTTYFPVDHGRLAPNFDVSPNQAVHKEEVVSVSQDENEDDAEDESDRSSSPVDRVQRISAELSQGQASDQQDVSSVPTDEEGDEVGKISDSSNSPVNKIRTDSADLPPNQVIHQEDVSPASKIDDEGEPEGRSEFSSSSVTKVQRVLAESYNKSTLRFGDGVVQKAKDHPHVTSISGQWEHDRAAREGRFSEMATTSDIDIFPGDQDLTDQYKAESLKGQVTFPSMEAGKAAELASDPDIGEAYGRGHTDTESAMEELHNESEYVSERESSKSLTSTSLHGKEQEIARNDEDDGDLSAKRGSFRYAANASLGIMDMEAAALSESSESEASTSGKPRGEEPKTVHHELEESEPDDTDGQAGELGRAELEPIGPERLEDQTSELADTENEESGLSEPRSESESQSVEAFDSDSDVIITGSITHPVLPDSGQGGVPPIDGTERRESSSHHSSTSAEDEDGVAEDEECFAENDNFITEKIQPLSLQNDLLEATKATPLTAVSSYGITPLSSNHDPDQALDPALLDPHLSNVPSVELVASSSFFRQFVPDQSNEPTSIINTVPPPAAELVAADPTFDTHSTGLDSSFPSREFPHHQDGERESPSIGISSTYPAPTHHTSDSSSLSSGLRTAHAYFAPLTQLPSHHFAVIDTLTLVTSSTPPVRASSGPKDHFLTLHLTDPSQYPNFIAAQIFRPYREALPSAQAGDVALLRNFKVVSAKRRLGLLSTEESAWAVWGADQRVEQDAEEEVQVNGPPVEWGHDEEQRVRELKGWWEGVKAAEAAVADEVGSEELEEEEEEEEGGGGSNSDPASEADEEE